MNRKTDHHMAGRRRLALALLAVLGMGVVTASPAVAQDQLETRGQDKSPDDKAETKLDAPKDAKLQTSAPTLKNERKGTELIKAEEFRESRKFESDKKIDEQIVRLKNLIERAPANHPDIAEFKFNLAELYWAKSKGYELRAFEKQDECFALKDKGDDKKAKACDNSMKQMLAEAKRLREETVTHYVDLIKNYKTFKFIDEVYYYLGANLMEIGKRPQALDIFRELVREYPQSKYIPNVLVAFGDYYFDADEMGEALKAYDRVTQSYQNSAVYGYATYKKAWCYFNLDDKKRALDLFLETLNYANKRKDLPNSAPLAKQAMKDIVSTYAFVGAAGKAIPFFQKISGDDRQQWLDMSERLAIYYSDKGNFASAMSMYRELIQINKESVRVLEYQYQIVRNQVSDNSYSVETLKQLVMLMKLVQLADEGKFKDRDKDPAAYKETRAKIEELARNWATVYHREAQQTKNADLYSKAYHLYKNYLETFKDSADLYRMTFFYGELLYKLQQWEAAARTYEKALEIDEKGQYTKEIVHSVVLAYFKVVTISEAKAQLQEGAKDIVDSTDKKKSDAKDKKGKKGKEEPEPEVAKVEIPKKKDMPEINQRLVKACERYVKLAPDGDRIVDVKFTMARTYYDHNHLAEAAQIFKDIAYSHSKHRLAVIAGNLHLDSLNLLQRYDELEAEVLAYLDKKPVEDEGFIEDLTALASAIGFKKCTILDEKEQWKQAADCFVEFYRSYPDSEYVDKALYNAALDFERMRDLGKAIRVRFFLLKARPESELAPVTLYNIGGNYHALAIYSQAARFYELFVVNFPDDEKAEDALANASTFRQGLGEYKKAIENYNRYLELFAKKKPERAAEVFFQIAKVHEKQDQKKKAFEHYEQYLSKWARSGTDDHRLEAHMKLGMYYWEREGKTNRKKALAEFERTLAEYNKLSDTAKSTMTKGRDAAAQAMFMIGEDVFESMAAMDIDSKDEKELQKRLKAKLDKAIEAKKIYEKVILFKRPDWAIASLYRIGTNMENLANTIRKSRCPKRLTADQCEIYKGILEDNAKQIEDDAVSFYVKALDTARQANWFNRYTKEAETHLARLRPRDYRKPAELRAEPDHMQLGFSSVEFLKTMKEDDRLKDMDDQGADSPSNAKPDTGAN